MSEPTYRLGMNRIPIIEKPDADFPWADYMGCFQPEELTAGELLFRIGKGFGFTSVFSGDGYPRVANWHESQFVAVDMDTEDERSSLETLRANPLVSYHGALIYPTHSHTPERPRHRVVFLVEVPFRNPHTYKLAIQACNRFFEGADRSGNINKTWMANGKIDFHGWWEQCHYPERISLTKDHVINYVLQYKKLLDRDQEQQRKQQQRSYEQSGEDSYMPLAELSRRLQKMDAYALSYDEWVKLCAAVAHAYGDNAYWVVKDWSDRPGKQPLTMNKWKSFTLDNPQPAGYGTIVHMLKERNV